MNRPEIASALREFAEERLNAAAYPDCSHRFDLFECPRCHGIELELAIDRHPEDSPGDFHGVLHLACAICGHRWVGFGVTRVGPPPELSRLERPLCDCGGRIFAAGNCERWENWGFFDEGTVVARCWTCSALSAVFDTD